MNESSTEYTGRGYSQNTSENYERYFVPAIAEPVAKELIETASLRPGEYVLDVACGTGVVARMAAERVGADGRVVGTDINPGMLAVARSVGSPGIPIEWREAPAEGLPFPDQTFDVVLCQLSLQFFPDKSGALKEMRRVLKTGDRVAINVPGTITRPFVIMADTLARHIDTELKGFVYQVFSLDDEAELRRLLKGAGFRAVHSEARAETFRLPAPKDFLWQYIYSTPLREAVDSADEDRRRAVEREVVAEWRQFAEDGGITYDQAIIFATAVG